MWIILTAPQFNKDVKKIDRKIQEKIFIFTKDLEKDSFPAGYDIKKLKGLENEYRCRFGDYRLIYKIYKKEIVILLLAAGHRKDVYVK